MRKEWLAGALALVIVALVGYVWFAPPAREPAPNVRLDMLNGGQAELGEYRGEPVMLVFWATTCPTCVAEMPEVVALHNDLADDGLNIVGVAMDYDPREQVEALVERRQLPYEIVLDNGGTIATAFNDVRLTPTTVLIDPEGGVVWQRIGPIDFDGLRRQLEPMLAEGQSA
ncbi:TlpA family protein disulfide reductase [Spiribacter vilamensis]|uniref:Peroxiredoxin n=1 Tax=Spiribacter vilamensis TaxID=531306 RepID=A0A4Q8D309_9GAMM|nr:TlpA disulfide reductase family protein [Spiribacter vilamensis]RZU99710.1 peroxiredoxin [Spiribacter vilamensis]TVO61343.1 TlpA family protein disulfide reductase [Spiribacter vilamensis]